MNIDEKFIFDFLISIVKNQNNNDNQTTPASYQTTGTTSSETTDLNYSQSFLKSDHTNIQLLLLYFFLYKDVTDKIHSTEKNLKDIENKCTNCYVNKKENKEDSKFSKNFYVMVATLIISILTLCFSLFVYYNSLATK